MKADLVSRYDLRVPRYTSYPTAPHFSAAVDGDVYRAWLAALDPAGPLSLYFHIPFCDSLCWFCGCYTKIVQRYEPVREYLEVLLAEVDLVAGALSGRFTASHLHWGGGSPTMLTGEDWLRTVDRLRARFDLADDAEVAVELDPRDTTEAYVEALARAGVNRASIGVQDIDPEVQAAINRIQPFEVTARVVGWLRHHGIRAVNLDLMYGLPHQTGERVAAMVERALTLRPSRVALFGYAHVPWMKSHQRMIDEGALPGAGQRWRQFEIASSALVSAGYVPVGLDHFASPEDGMATAAGHGRLRRNFQGYTVDEAPVLLGLGASAIGSLPQGYAQNHPPLRQYGEEVTAGRFPIARGLALSENDRLRRSIIERLMCDLEVDVDPARFAPELARLAPLEADGVVEISGGHLRITPQGRPLVRLAASAFDAYLDVGEKRHSRAV